ncbi:MAG: DUF58 domain-containing protein [Lachnospiraceae bacterium]|nr:DUF58 domain-containing protein [Lachnospiraceae bacterium]
MKTFFRYLFYVLFLALLVFLYLFNNHAVTLLFLILAIVLPIQSIALFLLSYRKLSFRIDMRYGSTGREEENEVLLGATNPTILPFNKLYYYFTILNELNPNDTVHVYELSVSPKEILSYKIPVRFRNCGNYKAVLEKVVMSDLLGFVTRTVSVNKSAEVIVLPTEINLGDSLSEFRGSVSDEAIYEQNEKGNDPSEVFEIREYRTGDRPQQIHWKISAKEQELMVKEFSNVTGETFEILLANDYSDSKQIDAYFDVMYSVGMSLCKRNIAFSFCYFSSKESAVVKQSIVNTDQVLDFVISMYFAKQVPNGTAAALTYAESYDGVKHLLLLSTKQPQSKDGFRVLWNQNNLARLYQL